MVTSSSGLATGTKTLLGMVLLTIGFLASLATVLSFFGGVWWAFDVAANFRFQLGIVLAVAGALYWIVVGQGAAILFLIAAAVNVALVVPLWIGDQAVAASEDRLDVVTFNVEREVAARPEILQWLGALDADLVFLQETTDEWVTAIQESGLEMEILAVPPAQAVHGTTVLARTDATATVQAIGSRNEHVVEVSAAIGSRQVTIFSLNPPSPSSQRDAETRDEVLAELAEVVRARTEPVAVIGDLGATRWSYAFRQLLADGGLVDSEDGFGFQGSWPASDVPVLRTVIAVPVDHLLTSRLLTTTDRALGPKMGSNHRPLLVELARADG